MKTELMGFLRPDGRWGYRDHTLVVPVHAALCEIAVDVADAATGEVIALRHEWDSPRGHADQARVLAALLGFATHPNVGATLILGIGDEVELFGQALADAQKPHRIVRLDRAGTFDSLETAAKDALAELLVEKVPAVRQPAPLSTLCLGLECGSSDAFSGITANPALGVASDRLVESGGTSILAEITELLGAEHLLAKRAVTEAVARQIIEVVARFEKDVARIGVDLLGSQPAPGNIAGGLTTIEEKSMGAARKGGTGPISGVVEYAERPSAPGLYIMDTPGQDIEQMVAMVAGGAQIVAFTTGLGTPTGSPIAPCLKISSNSDVAQRLPELIDIDAGTVLAGTPIEVIGQRILDELIEVASGRLTKAELRGNHEFALSFIRPTGA
ncbi:UxaA family hydrolase [Nocardia sp. NPDC050630]|uniref:UxaA family hydrolase n=1 Tax=Nocardia sp. NPDC050630 TaxID=3364321 RepID=UPI0037A52A21